MLPAGQRALSPWQPKSDRARKPGFRKRHTRTARLLDLVSNLGSVRRRRVDDDDSRTRPSRCARAVRVMPLP